jgi:ribosome-binding ATPase YchF (GTP1/OBG family)
MKIGIVGLPNVGKSTLFNAMTRAGALAANYPFATIEPNIGIVKVPDPRVDYLSKQFRAKSTVHAAIEFVDIAGLVKGASKGEGLGNKFLAKIREVDAIVHVVRAFKSGDIIHVEGSVDPKRDIETINTELELADLEVKERRDAKGKAAADLPMLMDKPVIYCVNVGEEEAGRAAFSFSETLAPAELAKVGCEFLVPLLEQSSARRVSSNENAARPAVVFLCAKLEEEIANIADDGERREFMAAYGLTESGLDKLAAVAYRTLGLVSYLTAGEQEVRAWTIKNGTKAPGAAGKIHTDFEKGFIKAEVIGFDEFKKFAEDLGGKAVGAARANMGDLAMQNARENGKVRVEGKDYVVRDGDIVHFRFNV